MHRSQLRVLAREHALGQIERSDYRRRRSILIDEIASGAVAIRREPPPRAGGGGLAPLARGLKASPIHVLVGLAVVVALAWALIAGRDRGVPPREDSMAPAAQTPSSARMPAARALVEGFLRERNWSEENLARFKASWDALTPNEQVEARASPWFRRLLGALRDEINAHKALAEFDGTGSASAASKRLAGFGEFLGIGAELPAVGAPAPASSSPATGAEAMPIPPAREASGSPPVPPRATDPGPLTGSEWLAARADDDLTLQLVAANHLDNIEALIAAHPGVELQLLAFEHRDPRYRLVHGVFATRDEANQAYRELPRDLATAEQPLIRRLGDLRGDNAPAPPGAVPATRYTLQVFASASRENVDRLISRYPSLEMRVQSQSDATAGFRVLVGEYTSAEAARIAAGKLPAALIQELGEPLVRTLHPEP